MYTIDKEYYQEEIIKKSKFICHLFPVTDVLDAQKYLEKIKKQYYDATHNCYCYITKDTIKFSDDGEPSQTAGIVIYNVLKNHDLSNVIAIVTRYFGGIKLGAGGLVRAYSSSVANVLKDVSLIEIRDFVLLTINCQYNYLTDIKKVCSAYEEIDIIFQDVITINYKIPKDDYPTIQEKLINITNNNILLNVLPFKK